MKTLVITCYSIMLCSCEVLMVPIVLLDFQLHFFGTVKNVSASKHVA